MIARIIVTYEIEMPDEEKPKLKQKIKDKDFESLADTFNIGEDDPVEYYIEFD